LGFYVFGALIKVLKGCRFRLDEDVKAVVVQWLQHQPRDYFMEGTISWYVNGIPASVPMGTIFNSLSFFAITIPELVSFEQASYNNVE
jgi:hypothetical protein